MSPDVTPHPCPVCDEPVDPIAVLDDAVATDTPAQCPACGTDRRVVCAVARGDVDVEELQPAFEDADAMVIPDALHRERADRLRDLPDPATEEREGVYT